MAGPEPQRACAGCVHFRNDPSYLEAAVKGLTVMGSGHASVRAQDGICQRHDRFVGPRSSCADFTAKP
jgi:hypothetical protein